MRKSIDADIYAKNTFKYVLGNARKTVNNACKQISSIKPTGVYGYK